MLHSIQTLERLEIGATDGNIGKVRTLISTMPAGRFGISWPTPAAG